MQNVYTTPLKYKNFNDQERHATLNFHLTPREFTDWLTDNMTAGERMLETFKELSDRAEKNPDAPMERNDILAILRFVKVLSELSYGIPSEDGEVFDKTDLPMFIHSAKYDAFRLFLFTNPKELNEFANTLLNEDVIAEFTKVVGTLETQDETSEPAKELTDEQLLKLNFKDMTPSQQQRAFELKSKSA